MADINFDGAFEQWAQEHGDKFESDPVSFLRLDDWSKIDDPDRRSGYDVEAAFEIAEAHCRESGAIVNQVVCHMREQGPVVEGYYLNSLELVYFNFRQSELPMVIFTVRATYLIGD